MDKPLSGTPISLRLPIDLKKWLQHQAIENSRSLNREIVDRLRESMQEQQKKETAKKS
jgi:hypothetical protein